MGKKQYDWTQALPMFGPKVVMNFWAKVDQKAADECWPWVASLFRDGYGCFSMPFNDGEQRTRKASRVAWAIVHGRWPEADELVEHTCDTTSALNVKHGKHGYRRCCNPRHLVLGSNDSNMQRMAETKRASQGDGHWTRQRPDDVLRGEKVGTSKIGRNDVLTMRIAFLFAETWGMKGLGVQLAVEFKVTTALVSQVKLNQWWKDAVVPERLVAIVKRLPRPSSLDDVVTFSKRLVGATEAELLDLEKSLQ